MGQLILLPVLATIIENYSWRWAIGLIITISVVMFFIIFLFMRNTPKEIGILPYGQTEDIEVVHDQSKGNPIVIAFKGLADAIRAKEFWLLAGSFFFCGFSTNGLVGTHFISYCISFGIPIVTAASLLSFMGVFNMVGTTLSGWLSDRIDNRRFCFGIIYLEALHLSCCLLR